MKAFSEEWIIAFAEKINSNNNYAETAYGLVWSIILSVNEGEKEINIFLDLQEGKCNEARIASARDLEQADFIISANNDTWQKILTGVLEPISALMTNKVELKKGNVASLIQYINSGKEILKSASQIHTDF